MPVGVVVRLLGRAKCGCGSMTTHESVLNDAMAELLQDMRSERRAMPEQTDVLAEGGVVDIFVERYGVRPVVVETEFMPASSVETDAKKRLGKKTKKGKTIESVVAIRVPGKFKKLAGKTMRQSLKSATDLQYAVYQPERFPEKPGTWINGSLFDISNIVSLTAIPTNEVKKCVDLMEQNIDNISDLLEHSGTTTKKRIAMLLSQKETPQTWKMAGLILSNAFVFHSHIAGEHNIHTLHELRVLDTIPLSRLVKEWMGIITNVNYYAIFDVARKILMAVDDDTARDMIESLTLMSDSVNAMNLRTSTDMYGSLIQRMITDRKTLASFYTLPVSATLLAQLLAPPAQSDVYKTPEMMSTIRVGDLACGTGTLLTTLYKVLISNFEADGQKMSTIHHKMMGQAIFGFDILPAAVHLTVSGLAEIYPKTLFKDTKIGIMQFGKYNNVYRLGSLDLIDDQTTFDEMGDYVTGTSSTTFHNPEVKNEFFDIIIMNPPYTSSKTLGVGKNLMFASLNNDRRTQAGMADLAAKKFQGTCKSGNAGAATYFMAIADKKLKCGGRLGIVLPATIASGPEWIKVRKLLAEQYDDVTVISLASPSPKGNSFSYDTDTGEVLLICKKSTKPNKKIPHGKFLTLYERPKSELHSLAVANELRKFSGASRLDDNNNYRLSTLEVGGASVGTIVNAPLYEHGWWSVSVRDTVVLQFIYNLTRNKFVVPDTWREHALYMTTPDDKGYTFGLDNRDVADCKPDDRRAPFLIKPIRPISSHFLLVNNDAATQNSIIFEPDKIGEEKSGINSELVKRAVSAATRLCINRKCRYNSQRVLFPFTVKKTMGSSAFTCFEVPEKYERALAVWGNTSLGIMCFWAHAGKQQLGRVTATRESMKTMPILDLDRISNKALKKLNTIFEKYKNKPLINIHLLYKDKVRTSMDEEVLSALGVSESLDSVRRRFCREPSVRGTKQDSRDLDN